MTSFSRLLAGTVTVLVVAVTVLVIGVGRSLRVDLEQASITDLRRHAELLRLTLPADSAEWPGVLKKASAATGLRVTLIDRTGRVRADSDPATAGDLDRVENHAGRPEVAAALRAEVGVDHRTSSTIGTGFWYVALPGGPGETVVRVAMADEQMNAIIRRARRPVYLAASLALLLGAGLALLAARRITAPLAEIGLAAQAIARGETPTLPFSAIPDVDRLSANLRSMHEQLVQRFESLRRKQVETAAIVDSMVEGVLATDQNGGILTANPAARRLLGYGPDDRLPELRAVFRSKEAREAIDQATDLGESVTDREINLGDRTYLVNIRPLGGGGVVVVLHDLTHLKRLETIRRDFVANASHELKTPLTAISGYAETLIANQPEPAVAKQFLETILANARRMQRLVDDQLDLSRIESGGWAPEPQSIAIEPAAQEAWALAIPSQGEAPTLEINLDPGATFLFADPEALRQVFRNLFENAIRYTAPTGRVRVTASPDEGFTNLRITDTGTGISSEHLPRIFERFYRADPSRSREQGGTGLGLAIVKHLVEAHGGRVSASSDFGQGTVILCRWPTR